MEFQWPLILFTLFLSWAAGLFVAQSICAVKGASEKTQMVSLAVSFALMVIGGIAVFFHLEHWERIFNGFGNLTSGITQELIGIVLLVIMMVANYVILRRSEGKIPIALAVINTIVVLMLLIAMGHSYMIHARPTWNSIAQLLSLVGNACILGPATFIIIKALVNKEESDGTDGALSIAGSAANAITTAAYVVAMGVASSSFSEVAYYFDGILAQSAMADSGIYSPFAGVNLLFVIIALAAALAALAFALVGKKQGKWAVCGPLILICGVASAVSLRVLMYATGGAVFMYF